MEGSRVVWDQDKVKRSFLVDCESVNFIGVHGLGQFLTTTRQFPIKPIQKVGKYIFSRSNPKAESRAYPSPSTERDEFKLLTYETNGLLLEPFRLKLIGVAPDFGGPFVLSMRSQTLAFLQGCCSLPISRLYLFREKVKEAPEDELS
ncbi:hypothetical protein FF1_021778 [Malus domestica]